MQREKVPYNPALDDGGGAPGAEPQWYVPGEIGDNVYTDSFGSNNDAIDIFSCPKPQELYMPQITSGDPILGFAPLHTQAPENLSNSASYHYFRSRSFSPTQPNFPDRIRPSNDNSHSQSTAVAIQSNSYHPVSPEFSIDHASGVGSNGHAVWPRLTFPGYEHDHTSIFPSQDESFYVSDEELLEFLQSSLPLAQNDTGDPQVRNTRDLAASQGLWSPASSHKPNPQPFMTASSPNTSMPRYFIPQPNNTADHPTQPQAIDVDFTGAPPDLQAHYASPSYQRVNHLPPPSTEDPVFNSSPFYWPPTYQEDSPPHQGFFGDRASGDMLDPVGIGAACQRAHLYGHAEQPPHPISEVWTHYQQANLGSPGSPIMANQHEDSPPQSLFSSSEVFGYTSGKGSSDGASSSSPTTLIQRGARTPATDPPDPPNYGGLNTFLSQHDSLSQVRKRSKQCRPPVLKLGDCPPNLRRYFSTDIPIPPRECDTMYDKYGDRTCCIKCGYDVTPPRRLGLKYEHVSAHIDNRPYYCLKCHRGFFRKSNHSKTPHLPLWRTIPPPSR